MTSTTGAFDRTNGDNNSIEQDCPAIHPLHQVQHQPATTGPQHVPLLPRTADVTPRQPLNVTSHARQRVRRACLECRTKKVKCDGAETCGRCASYSIACEYVEFNGNTLRASNAIDTSQVERLESRVASMEQMFKEFLVQFQTTQSDKRLPNSHRNAVSPSVPPAQHAIVIPDEPMLEKCTNSRNDQNVSGIQQLLDAAEADAACLRPFEYVGNPSEQHLHWQPVDESQDHDSHGHTDPTECDGNGRCYADGYGELDVDSHGQLRYVGLGSTASVAVENCIGLRRYITKALEKKGYGPEESFFTSPEATHFEDSSSAQQSDLELPPPEFVDTLISIYTKEVSHLFPITIEDEIRNGYHTLLIPGKWDPGHAAAFFALLAVAVPLLSTHSSVFETIDRKWLVSGPVFYNQAMHFINIPSNGKSQRKEKSRDFVVAMGLLSVYLAETGSQAEAWISLGRAIRIAQDIGLHRSPKKLRLPKDDWDRRRYIWWCLYVLERQLCTALGRPLSINDEDCDTEIPTPTSGSHPEYSASFTSMIHLHRIIGSILKIVNSVKNANSWRSETDDGKKHELQSRVREANDALQRWAKDMVPPHMKTAKSGRLLAEKHIALSSFFSAVMLLHRAFIQNPHRPSPLNGTQAQLKSAKAATDCIRGTPEFLESVPKSHFVVFHGQFVFVAALILLSCVRWSEDPKFVYQALRDVEDAMQILYGLGSFWKGAVKCRGIVEEYLEFTFKVLQGDRNCHFACDHSNQLHDVRRCKSRKRRPTGVPTGAQPKKARLNGPAHQQKAATRSERLVCDPSAMETPISGAVVNAAPNFAVPALITSAAQSQELMDGTLLFDNTINNFLGAIDPVMDFQGQLDSVFDGDIYSSGLVSQSPESQALMRN